MFSRTGANSPFSRRVSKKAASVLHNWRWVRSFKRAAFA